MKQLYKEAGLSILLAFTMHVNSFAQETDTNSFDRVKSFSTPWHVAFADINLDGIQDMVGVNGNSNTNIDILLGTTNGTFELSTTLDGSSGQEYYKVLLEDLNNDAFSDIIAYSGVSAVIFMSDEEGNYSEISLDSEPLVDPTTTLIADFNEDENPDLIFNKYVYINDGDGTFTKINRLLFGEGPVSGSGPTVTSDYNGDGNLDLVIGDPGSGFIYFFEGNGDGTFSLTPNLQYEALPEKIEAYDFNNDTMDDILFWDTSGDEWEFIVLFNDENHQFNESDTLYLGHNFFTILNVGDIDLDGSVDIIGSNDTDILYWPVSQDGTIGEMSLFDLGLSSLRGLHYTNAIGEDFEDLIIEDGFGTTLIFSDKLNALIEQTSSSLTYSGKPYNAIETDVDVDSVAIVEQGTETPIINTGEYIVEVFVIDEDYEGHKTFPVSIQKAPLEISVDEVTRSYGEDNPEFVVNYSGFVNEENSDDLIEVARAETEATTSSSVGEYPIEVTGALSNNYEIEHINGTLTINKTLLTVEGPNLSIPENSEIPELELTFSGFVNGEDVEDLIEIPVANTTATSQSPPGQYTISVSGGESINYSFELIDGTLTIEEVLSVSNESRTIVYPNPVKGNLIKLESAEEIQEVSLLSIEGKITSLKFHDKGVEITNILPGVYFLKIQYLNNSTETIRLLVD